MVKNLKEKVLQRIYDILSQEDFGKAYDSKGEKEYLQDLEVLTNLLNSLSGGETVEDYAWEEISNNANSIASTPYGNTNTTCIQCNNYKRAMASGGPLICNCVIPNINRIY